MDSGITFSELLQYTEVETKRWKDWFAAHSAVLDQPCDIAKAGTVRLLLLHIFATESFFAYTILGLEKPDWTKLPIDTVDELFAIGEDARQRFHRFILDAQTSNWQEKTELGFAGLRASRRKMMAQALLHGIHHRAQLATFLRQQGFNGMWVHDLILTDAML